MIIGKAAACPAPPSADTPPPTGLMAINCAKFPVANLAWVPAPPMPVIMVLGVVKIGILEPPVPTTAVPPLAETICGEMIAPPPAAFDGMYVMGRMVCHGCVAPEAFTSWILVN